MKRIYTLRRLFRDGIRGQANLDDAITHGDAPARRVAILAAFWVKINSPRKRLLNYSRNVRS